MYRDSEFVELYRAGDDLIGREVSLHFLNHVWDVSGKIAYVSDACGCLLVQVNTTGLPHDYPHTVIRVHQEDSCKEHIKRRDKKQDAYLGLKYED